MSINEQPIRIYNLYKNEQGEEEQKEDKFVRE